MTGAGLGHQLRAGVNWIHEPHLFVRVGQGTSGIFTLGANDLNGPVTSILVIGGNTEFNIPIDSYSSVLAGRLEGDQPPDPESRRALGLRRRHPVRPEPECELPGAAGGRPGPAVSPGRRSRTSGRSRRGDKDNIQPRLGFVYDLHGAGREVVRGGWGIYTDFAYTNANVLTAAIDAIGGGGPVFVANAPSGIRRPDGTFFRVTDPLSIIASQNQVNPDIPPLAGEVVSPRLEQPVTYQTSLGWARELGPSTWVSADYVRVDGRDLNLRLRPNAIVGGRRYLGDLAHSAQFDRLSNGHQQGPQQLRRLILALRRRAVNGLDRQRLVHARARRPATWARPTTKSSRT